MARPDQALVITHLLVDDEREGEVYTVVLADFVSTVDDPENPGAHRETIISLLNAAILSRYPDSAERQPRLLPVSAEEFANIKLDVLQNLLRWVKAEPGRVM